jgi:hypothetical protein
MKKSRKQAKKTTQVSDIKPKKDVKGGWGITAFAPKSDPPKQDTINLGLLIG